jgi:hypothetical protein
MPAFDRLRRRPQPSGVPRQSIVRLLAIALAASQAGCGAVPVPPGSPPGTNEPAITQGPTPTVPPIPGHEVYGFVPYWEMDEGIAAHLAATTLTTLGLFSVTNTSRGTIDTGQNGYQKITGATGRRMIREAHHRGVRVELVFTSFGLARNATLFEDRTLQDATIGALTGMVGELGLDGVDVDVESLDPGLVPAYGAFVGRLRQAIVAADPSDTVSVATTGGPLGAAMAAVAAESAVDRIFLMGYDYRTAGSDPGASAPLGRRDGSEKTLAWSLDLYQALGVPAERTLLGLPLYGMSWPVAGPVIGAPATGRGEPWIPGQHLDLLGNTTIVPLFDEVEVVDVYLLASDGSTPPPAPDAAGSPVAALSSEPPSTGPGADRSWQAIYVDSPATLAPKLALANTRGLAGAGFWAIGYERGLPEFTALIARFAAGDTVP